MANLDELYLECFHEVERQFPGSAPHVLKEMANRLFEETRSDISRRYCESRERELRTMEFATALQTIPEIRGMKPHDRRPDNAEK